LGAKILPLKQHAWTAAVINHNGAGLVALTITSLKQLDDPPAQILLVDDGSTDDGLSQVREAHPDVEIVPLGRNTGRPTIVRNRALASAKHSLVLLTDNDVTFAPDAIEQMRRAMIEKGAVVCTPLVVYEDDPTRICARAHGLHYLCWSAAAGEETVEAMRARGTQPGSGCGIQLIDTSRLPDGVRFDENFVLGWGDDGELQHRLRIAGLGCYSAPGALVYHRRVRTRARYYGQVHNRWLLLLKDYQLRTLILAAPALLSYELLLGVWLLMIGQGGSYVRALRDVLRRAGQIRQDRVTVQSIRRVPDKDLLCATSLAMPQHMKKRRLLAQGMAVLSFGFRVYWRLIQVFL
jgi:GT2 family glycosyltransferase